MARDRVGRGQGQSEVRLRIGGAEIAVTGASREDCLRQLERAVQALEAETSGYRVTAAGEGYLAGWREAQGGR